MRASLRLVPTDTPYSGGPAGGPGSAPKSGNGKKLASTVLVVEDEILVRMPTAEYLRDSGYRVIEASNAADAQAVFEAGEPIEIVFTDINMPGAMNGVALAEWVLKEHPDVWVILTSAVPPAQGLNGMSFLPKPYAFETLLAQLKRLLGV
jgi:DNA-binding NtrC family response regulator